MMKIIEVNATDFHEIKGQEHVKRALEVAAVRERVEAARSVQRDRFQETSPQTNADMGPGEVGQFCPLDETRHPTSPRRFSIGLGGWFRDRKLMTFTFWETVIRLD